MSPRPAQFDHVITAIPKGDKDLLWLDTTPEVAPFAHKADGAIAR